MDKAELDPKVGDLVIISRPASTRPYAARIEKLATVTATRPRSFDAGGLCFRKDGKEWKGHNRVRPMLSDPFEEDWIALAEMNQTARATTGKGPEPGIGAGLAR